MRFTENGPETHCIGGAVMVTEIRNFPSDGIKPNLLINTQALFLLEGKVFIEIGVENLIGVIH